MNAMNDAAREAAAQTAAPVWNPAADAPSPPRFRPKLKSSLPRVLLQDNRSLSINLERKLTNLLKARARVESRWESNKRKLIVAVRSSRLLNAQRRASWAPAAAAEAAAAEVEIAAGARGASASDRSHLASWRQATLICRRRDDGADELLANANTGTTASDWREPKPAGGDRDSPNLVPATATRPLVQTDGATVQLPLIYGSSKKAPRIHDDSAPRSTPPPQSQEQQPHGQQRGQQHQQYRQRQRQQLGGEQLELTAEEQQPQLRGPHAQAAHRITPPPFRLRHLSLDNSFSSRATLAFSRSLTLAAPAAAALPQPPAPGRLQYDIHHQIEEEDRLVAFLTFRAKPRVANAGRQAMGV